MKVQVFGSSAVVAAFVLELGKEIQFVQHFCFQAVILGQEVKQLSGIPGRLDLSGHLGIHEHGQNRFRLRLHLLQLLDNNGTLVFQGLRTEETKIFKKNSSRRQVEAYLFYRWNFLIRIEIFVNVHGKVNHVGLAEKVQFCSQQFIFLVDLQSSGMQGKC